MPSTHSRIASTESLASVQSLKTAGIGVAGVCCGAAYDNCLSTSAEAGTLLLLLLLELPSPTLARDRVADATVDAPLSRTRAAAAAAAATSVGIEMGTPAEWDDGCESKNKIMC